MTHTKPIWLLLAADFDGTIREEIPAHHIAFRQELNNAGGWSAVIPNTGHPSVTAENLAPGRTIMWVIDPGGTPRFSGILWQHTHSIGKDNLTARIGGTGRYGYYRRRVLFNTTAYINRTPQNAAFRLLSRTEESGRSGISHVIDPEYRDDASTAPLTRYSFRYESEDLHNIGLTIDGMASLSPGGFDFDVDYTGSQKTGFGAVMAITARRGRALDLVLDTASNFVVNAYSCDATEMVNEAWVTGGVPEPVTDPVSGLTSFEVKIVGTSKLNPGRYPRLQGVFPGDRVTDLSFLQARASRETGQGRECRRFISGEIYDPGGQPVVGTVATGDTVRVRILDALADVDETFRVTAVAVTIDGDGKETVTVDLVQNSLIVTGGIRRPDTWSELALTHGRISRLEAQQR